MKIKLLLVMAVFCSATCLAQKKSDEFKTNEQQIIIKKQIAVDDLESQLKEIPFAAVRVFIRYKLATWLWKDGKDKTERAEALAVKAVEELFEKKDEIPSLYFNSLKPDIFALLETNAKEMTEKLKSKYDADSGSDNDLDDVDAILNKKDGEKIAADKIQKYVTGNSELNPFIVALIEKLQKRKSPEVSKILNTILILEETGRNSFSINSLSFIAQNFSDPMISIELKVRFTKIALNKINRAVQLPDSDLESAIDLLDSVIQFIPDITPDLLPEAKSLQTILSTRISQATREVREIYERIEASADELQATIAEAENAKEFTLKYRLYEQAAKLAFDENKYEVAISLIGKTTEEESPEVFPKLDFRIQQHDRFLDNLVEKALKKDDLTSAESAIKRMLNKLTKAEGLRKSAIYYFEKQNNALSSDALDKSMKLTIDSENSSVKIYTLFRLISAARKIDRNRLSEFTTKTAKAINSIPTLNADDKPGTKNYDNYVISIMVTNWNLLPVFSELTKENKNEAIDFADRINKKEVKTVANYALLVNSLNTEEKTAKLTHKQK